MSPSKVLRTVVAGATLLTALITSFVSYQAQPGFERTLAWDPASHGLNGVRLTQAWQSFDIAGILRETVTPHKYPPVHSYLQMPFYGALGIEPRAGALASSVALIGVIVSMGVLAWRLAKVQKVCASLTAVFLVATSPLVLVYGNILMLEIFSTLFNLVLFAVYLGIDESREGRRCAWVAGGLTLAFWLTSPNFALFWTVVILLWEILSLPRSTLGDGLSAVRSCFLSRRIFHPLNFLLLALLGLVLWVLLGGGFKTRMGSWKVTFSSWLSPFYFVALVLGFRIGWAIWKNRAWLRRHTPHKLTVCFWSVLVPLYGWYVLLYPPRVRIFLDYLMASGASESMTAADRWMFYPRAILDDFSLVPWMGCVTLFFGMATFLKWRRLDRRIRFLLVYGGVTMTLCFLHQGRDPRFVLPIMPVLWILAAVFLAEMMGWFLRHDWIGLAPLGVVLLLTGDIRALYQERLPSMIRRHSCDHELSEVLKEIGSHLARIRSARVMGTFSGLSHHVVEWEVRKRRDIRRLELAWELENPVKRRPANPEAAYREIFEEWLKGPRHDVVIFIVRAPEGPYAPEPQDTRSHYVWKTRELMEAQDVYRPSVKRFYEGAGVWLYVYQSE